MLLHTMPMEKRKGIAGRHIVSCGTPAQKARDVLRTGNGAFLVEDGGKPDKETLTFWREELWAPQWEQPPKATVPVVATPAAISSSTKCRRLMILVFCSIGSKSFRSYPWLRAQTHVAAYLKNAR